MALYDVFRGRLGAEYPAYGRALWEPSPPILSCPVEIGDVGFIREGRFHRLFNALLSTDHPSHQFGVPEYHEPLIPKLTDHIRRGTLSPGHYCSAGVDIAVSEPGVLAGPDDCPHASFSCKSQRGAVLSLPVPAQRQDTLSLGAFGKWMVKHIDRWFAFAQDLELGIDQMEEIVLVTGCDRTRSWTNVAFLESGADSLVSFRVDVIGDRIDWHFSPEQIRGAVLNRGPSGENLPEDQCIFIRGFRVARTLRILPKHLRAAAKPSPNADGDSGADVELISIPTVSKDPFHLIVDYVAGRAPECDMVLVHDDDLAHWQISGNCDSEALETLQPDGVESSLYRSNMEIHTDLFHLPPAENSDPQIVRVAMLSMISCEPNLATQPRITSLASENVGPHAIGESVINLQSPQSGQDDVLGSLARANIDKHPFSSESTIPPHRVAVISVNGNQVTRSISLLHIPPELICCVLVHLSPHDIISCKRTCRMLYDMCSEPVLRYLVEMERCGVSDDMRPGLGYLERLLILEKREEAWAMLEFRRTVQVSGPPDSTVIFILYDLIDGAFFQGKIFDWTSQLPTGYDFVSFPSLLDPQDQKSEWKDLRLEIPFYNFGFAVHEHDLIAIMTRVDVGLPSDRNMILEMRLLRFSTGQPHPLAEQPIIFITTKTVFIGYTTVRMEIVGDFLALLITFNGEQDENEDMFFIVRWKKGETYHLRTPERGTCSYITFLSQDTLVIPNSTQNMLEVAKIVVDDDNTLRLVSLCMLHLPPHTRRASIVDFQCCAKPNPTGSGPIAVPAPSNRPFRDKAEDAVVIFRLSIEGVHQQTRILEMHKFMFIVHRRALLAHIPAAQRACPPFCITPNTTPVQVPWEVWGVSATRWFEDHRSTRWLTMTAGQRSVTMDSEDDAPTQVVVRDFNPYAVRAARALAAVSGQWQQGQQGDWSKQLPNGNRMTLKVKDSVISAGSIFEEDVRSSLPYVEVVTQTEYNYDGGVMIDEERILGLKYCPRHLISSFDVHILG